MTLSTKVAIRLPGDTAITARDVLNKAIEALCSVAGDGEWGPHHWPVTEEYDRDYMRGRNIGTVMGQGFHAITDVYYDPDGPLYPKSVTHRELNPEWYEDDNEESEYADSMAYPSCTYLLDMDTAYGCKYANGVNAWTLHLGAITVIREWLKRYGGTVLFEDESTGQWYYGDEPEGFAAVLGSGDSAQNWFHNIVQPIIEAEVAAEGGTITWEGR